MSQIIDAIGILTVALAFYTVGRLHGSRIFAQEAVKRDKARWLVDEAGEISFKWKD